MSGHLGFGVTDCAASKAFFLHALQPLGYGIVMEGEHGIGIGSKGKPALCLYQSSRTPAPLHLAFTAENRKQVQDFYRAALEAGGKGNGPPGLQPHYHPNDYGAYIIGPYGHNVEAVCHKPAAW